MERSLSDKNRDEQKLLTARKRERSFTAARPHGRHSRFGGTFIIQNIRSISERDLISHKPLESAFIMNLSSGKNKQRSSNRSSIDDEEINERRSAFSIRFVKILFSLKKHMGMIAKTKKIMTKTKKIEMKIFAAVYFHKTLNSEYKRSEVLGLK